MPYFTIQRKILLNTLGTKIYKRKTSYGAIGAYTIKKDSPLINSYRSSPVGILIAIKKSAYPLATQRTALRREIRNITLSSEQKLISQGKVIHLIVSKLLSDDNKNEITKDIRELAN